MFEWSTIHQIYHGRNFYTNANPAIGNDANSGTQESPFLTIARALLECRAGEGDKVWAYSSRVHLPGLGLYAFTENVHLDKIFTAIIGHFGVNVSSGIGIDIYNPFRPIEDCLVSGALVSGNGIDSGYRLKNAARSLIVRSDWLLIDEDPGQVGFELTADPVDPNLEFFGGNGFINCKASGNRIGGGVDKTTAFKLTDYGFEANYLLDPFVSKCERGIEITNSSTHGDHAIVGARFYDNDEPCHQADALHHWHLWGCLYDDLERGLDGWGRQLPWPNEEASWTFAHPDESPFRNIGALLSNKIGTISSTSMIREMLLSNLSNGGFGKMS